MKRIKNNKCLCIFCDGELDRVYETDGTVNDIVKILKDYGYYNNYNEDDWKYGVGIERAPRNNCCHSFEDIAAAIIEDHCFEDLEIWIGTPDKIV
jgi:hypothetical protein